MDDDRDVIDATRAFLAEFDAAAAAASDSHEDSEAEQSKVAEFRRHARLATSKTSHPTVAADPPPKPKPKARCAAKPKAEKPSKAATAVGTKAGKKSAKKSETVARGPAITETVPLAQPKTRKEEIEFMREQVRELEEKLRLLKRSTSRDDTPPSRPQVETDGLGSGLALARVGQQPKPKRIASMWEELAMRQYQQRQRAEVENLKLKSSLEDQLKVAKSLERMLKRSKTDVLTPKNHAKRGRKLQQKPSGEEITEFEELSSTVTDMYRRIDDAFADERFANSDVDFRDVSVRQDEATGTSIVVLNAKMVPFDVHTTAQAVWDYFINESMDTPGFYLERNVEITDDEVMKSNRVELEIKRYFGCFRGKIVGRRYREADRVIIVWAVLAEPVAVSDAPMDGIIMRQQGWTIVRRVDPGEVGEDASPVAVIRPSTWQSPCSTTTCPTTGESSSC